MRGLNCRDKRRISNSVFQEWKADVICLQETKVEGENGRQSNRCGEAGKLSMLNWRLVALEGDTNALGQ